MANKHPTPFKKAGPGRPKGMKNKCWNSLLYWFTLVDHNIEQLSPKDQVEIGVKGLSLLIEKMRSIPASPDESVKNVAADLGEQVKALDALEEVDEPTEVSK